LLPAIAACSAHLLLLLLLPLQEVVSLLVELWEEEFD
jgi:hypothetical protein